jgi:hypothetical protein
VSQIARDASPGGDEAADPTADPATRGYRAYLKGDLQAARRAFAELPPGPKQPFVKVMSGLPPGATATPRRVVARGRTGLLAIDRTSAKPLAWRRFQASVESIEAIGTSETILVSLDDAAAKEPERYRVLVLDASSLETRHEAKAATDATSSPDGRYIALFTARRAALIDATRYAPVAEFEPDLPEADVMHFEFSPDSRKLLVARRELAGSAPIRSIALLELPHGGTVWDRELDVERSLDPAWAFSADSAWLAFADGTGEKLELVDVARGETIASTSKCASSWRLAFSRSGALQATGTASCTFDVPRLAARRETRADPPALPERPEPLPADLAARLATKYCFDGHTIFPSDVRDCGATGREP